MFGLWNIILLYLYYMIVVVIIAMDFVCVGRLAGGGGVNAGSCLDPEITHGHGPLLPFACNLTTITITITITITWIFIQLHSSPYSF